MNTLNENFYSSCKPNLSKIVKITNNIFTIKDFFVNFNQAKNFLNDLNKWECDYYDFTTKSGAESTLPLLTGRYLQDNSLLKTNIKNFNLCSIDINFLYYGQRKKFDKLQSSNGTFDLPHHDSIDVPNERKQYVLLINLNDYPISTNFWSFDGNDLMVNDSYMVFIEKINNEYKNKKEMLKIPKTLSLDHTITYEPNQVLIYNSSLLHNASIEEKYTYSSPRTTLRLFFSCDSITNISTITYQ
jgi:hypothetical protein